MNQTENQLEQLEKLRITVDKQLEKMKFLFRLFGTPCFPRGELVAVTGKAKSGKTIFTSMLMMACTGSQVTEICRAPDIPPLRCLWYDTEQSEQSTQEILRNRISHNGEFVAELYDVFNVRSLPWESRMDLLETAVETFSPDLLVIDGVRDLLSDINDGVRAQELVERLMKLAQKSRCCVVCVLHQNKGAEDRNLRGWIGTEMTNKAFEVYACEKMMPQRIFSVEQTHTRKYDIGRLLYFTVDQQGMPLTSEAPQSSCETGSQKKKDYPLMNEAYIYWEGNDMKVRLHELFYDVLKKYKVLYYTDLQKYVMELLNCKDSGYWNNLFVNAKNQGFIVNGKNRQGKSIWKLPEPAIPESPDFFTECGDSPPY